MFASDRTYTIKAWAVNEDDEVISPVASLDVHLFEGTPTDVNNFNDYLNESQDVNDMIITQFTVLK